MNGYYIGSDIGGMWIKYQNQHGSSGWTTTDDSGVFRSRPVSFHMVRTQGYKSHMFGPNIVECGHVIILALLQVAGDEREWRITTEFKCCHSLDSEGYWKMVYGDILSWRRLITGRSGDRLLAIWRKWSCCTHLKQWPWVGILVLKEFKFFASQIHQLDFEQDTVMECCWINHFYRPCIPSVFLILFLLLKS